MTLDATASAPPEDEPLRGPTARQAYARFWRRIVVFSGRASIGEFWWPVLITFVGLVVGGVLLAVLLGLAAALQSAGSPAEAVPNALAGVLGLVLVVGSLAAALAGVAVSVRRLHDANLSGLLVLTALIPSVGALVLVVLSLLPASGEGRRFDRGAAAPGAAPLAPDPTTTTPVLTSADASLLDASPFDVWPEPAHPATAPMPAAVEQGPLPDAAVRRAWSSVGTVRSIEPPMSAPPAWRGQDYLLVTRPDAVPILSTDGLHGSEGVAALGPGAELFVAADGLETDPGDRWELALLAAVARRVRTGGMHLPAELERYGTLSTTALGVPAPDGWRTDEGAVGVLLGLPFPAAPGPVATSAGEVALVSVTALRPAELQQILDGGAAARARVAGRLAAMPAAALATRE